MHTTTTTSSGSTPIAPLILFLVLCLLFQLPTFTKASESLALPETIAEESLIMPNNLIPSVDAVSQEDQLVVLQSEEATHNDTTGSVDVILPRKASPQWTSPVQPQVIIQTQYTTVCPNCYTTPSYQYYLSPTSTTTATVTDYTSSANRIATTTTTVRGFITQNYNNQQYCSTLYANGGGLPTTRAGNCGTILVEEPPATNAASEVTVGGEGERSRLALVAVVVGVFVMGAVG